ncbi:hypothetical protein MJM28_31510, partial [Salmonella enterica subsp. enterica serovar Montevideo]|nr:hypothetical protein [Salmonella enterica subsp. enterica serovar Montevideo]
VLTGERYKTIAKETAGILKGEYGHTPVPVNAGLQARVLEGGATVSTSSMAFPARVMPFSCAWRLTSASSSASSGLSKSAGRQV